MNTSRATCTDCHERIPAGCEWTQTYYVIPADRDQLRNTVHNSKFLWHRYPVLRCPACGESHSWKSDAVQKYLERLATLQVAIQQEEETP